MDISNWLPIITNAIITICIFYVALRAYKHFTKQIFQEIVDDAIAKLDYSIKTLNALRNVKK